MKNQKFENVEMGKMQSFPIQKKTIKKQNKQTKKKENVKCRLLICTKGLAEYLHHKTALEMPRVYNK